MLVPKVVNKKNHTHTKKDVYIGRPSILGNMFSHQGGTIAKYRVATREEAVIEYGKWLHGRIVQKDQMIISAIRNIPEDANLVCWCSPLRCHGEMIVNAWRWLKNHPEY